MGSSFGKLLSSPRAAQAGVGVGGWLCGDHEGTTNPRTGGCWEHTCPETHNQQRILAHPGSWSSSGRHPSPHTSSWDPAVLPRRCPLHPLSTPDPQLSPTPFFHGGGGRVNLELFLSVSQLLTGGGQESGMHWGAKGATLGLYSPVSTHTPAVAASG